MRFSPDPTSELTLEWIVRQLYQISGSISDIQDTASDSNLDGGDAETQFQVFSVDGGGA